jgi:hypothetical protein
VSLGETPVNRRRIVLCEIFDARVPTIDLPGREFERSLLHDDVALMWLVTIFISCTHVLHSTETCEHFGCRRPPRLHAFVLDPVCLETLQVMMTNRFTFGDLKVKEMIAASLEQIGQQKQMELV